MKYATINNALKGMSIEEINAIADGMGKMEVHIADPVKKDMEAIKYITAPQVAQAKKLHKKMVDLVMKRSVFSKTNDPMDTATMVYQKLIVSQEGGKDEPKVNTVELGVSMLASNQLVRSQKLHVEKGIKLPVGTKRSDNKESDCGGMLRFDANEYCLPTKDIIGIKFNRANDLEESIVSHPLWIKQNGMNPVIAIEMFDGYLYDVINNCDYNGELPSMDGTWKRYIFLKSTPSEIRQEAMLGINTIVEYEGKLMIDNNRAFKCIDFLSYGAASVLKDKGNLPLKKFAKGFARLAQWSPFSRDYGMLNSFWVLNGCFDLAVEDNGKVTTANDGIAYVLVDVIKTAIKRITGIEFDNKDLIGKAVQCRPGLAKCMAMIVSHSTMKAIVMRHDKDGIDKVIGADVEVPEFLADDNCNKADVKSGRDISFNVLAPMVELGKPNFNMQLITKIINSEDFGEIMNTAYEDAFTKRFSYLDPEQIKAIADIKSVMAGTDSGALMAFAPALTNNINAIRKNAIETDAKAFLKDLDRMSLPMRASKWERFTGDFGSVFGVRLLNANEVYIPGMAIGKEIEIVRFPSVCGFEHYSATTVGTKTIIRRMHKAIAECKINTMEYSAIMEYITTLDSNIMMAPIDQAFRDLTGGSDTDSDMGIATRDKKVVKAIRENEPLAIDSVKPIKKIDMGVLDHDGHIRAYLNAVQAPKVGVVCNHITALYELKSLSKEVQISVIKGALEIKTDGSNEYERQLNKDMTLGLAPAEDGSNKGVIAILAEMKAVDLTDDASRTALIDDAIVIAKTINDRAIDAPKTGDSVDEGMVTWRKYVKSDIFFDLDLEEVVTNDGTSYKITAIGATEENFDKDHCGKLSKVRLDLAKKFESKINELLHDTAKLGAKEKSLMIAVGSRPEVSSFSFLKEMYKDESGMKRSDTNGVGNDFLVRQKVSWYGNHIKAIKNMGLMVAAVNNLNGVQIGRLAMHASASTKDGVGDVINNNFMSVCFPEAAMQMAAEYYNANTEIRQVIYAVNDAKLIDGEVIVMKNGTGYRPGEDAPVAICEARLDGEFVITQEDFPGIRFFITSDIKKEFKLPEVNGRILVRLHRNELKNRETLLAAKDKIDRAAYAVVYCKMMDKNHTAEEKKAKNFFDAIYLFDSKSKCTGRVRISIDGVDLMKVLHGKKFVVSDTKFGVVRSNKNKDIYAMSVLGDMTGVANSMSDSETVEE